MPPSTFATSVSPARSASRVASADRATDLAVDENPSVRGQLVERHTRAEEIEVDRDGPRDAGDGPLLGAANVDEQRRVVGRELAGHLVHRHRRKLVLVGRCGTGHPAELDVVDELGDARVAPADGAVRVGADGQGVPGLAQRVMDEQPAGQRLTDAEEQLDRLGGLDRADGRAQHAEHPALGAARHRPGRRRLGEDAAVAGPVARPPHRDLAVEAQDRAPDVRLAEHDAGVVDEVAGREVVGAVDDEVVAAR